MSLTKWLGRQRVDSPLFPAAPVFIAPDNTLELWSGRLTSAIEQFQEWREQHQGGEDPWASFGEVVRNTLHECCGAMLVTPYRIASQGKELIPLREANPLVQTNRINARKGIVGHVFTSGRSYVEGPSSQGALIDVLAGDADNRVAWCFVIQRGTQRLGVVTAGQFAGTCVQSTGILTLAEQLVTQFWIMTADAERMRTLEKFDPVCDLLSRPAFVEAAETALTESYRQGAPVAVAVLAFEGLRGMNDSGRWEVADELLREVSTLMSAKLRGEDRLGRFDGSRFVLLLRSVDSELATLIVRQLMAQLSTLCSDTGRWGAAIQVRCGLAGSGTSQPTLRALISQALSEAGRARTQNRLIASDVIEPALQEGSA